MIREVRCVDCHGMSFRIRYDAENNLSTFVCDSCGCLIDVKLARITHREGMHGAQRQ